MTNFEFLNNINKNSIKAQLPNFIKSLKNKIGFNTGYIDNIIEKNYKDYSKIDVYLIFGDCLLYPYISGDMVYKTINTFNISYHFTFKVNKSFDMNDFYNFLSQKIK